MRTGTQRTKRLPVRRARYFVFSDATLEYRELKFFRSRVLLYGFLFGLLTVGILLIANHAANDILGLGYNRVALLTTENRILKEELTGISERMKTLQSTVDDLAGKGNDLRLMVDLTPLDEETRSAGVGGSQAIPELSYVGTEANEILKTSRTLVDQLSREVNLQRESYASVYRKYAENKDLFAATPSIKPIIGNYSIRGYGMRVHPVLGIMRMHEGIDIVADVGTNVYATADGVVRYAGRTRGGYGTVIELSHGYGYSTLYAHLSKPLVRPGQSVKRGELIARSGRSGLVSGPHLHYEVKYRGRKMNPVDYFFDDVDASTYRDRLAAVSGR